MDAGQATTVQSVGNTGELLRFDFKTRPLERR
jgi:hypothetical protein